MTVPCDYLVDQNDEISSQHSAIQVKMILFSSEIFNVNISVVSTSVNEASISINEASINYKFKYQKFQETSAPI